MKNSVFREKRKAMAQESMRGEPLHLLEAYHRLVVKAAAPPPTYIHCCSWLSCSGADKQSGVDEDPEIGASPPVSSLICRLLKALSCKNGTKKPKSNNDDYKNYQILVHSFRTVKDLKANGIFFKPSPSQSLKDVSFRSHFFYARLELPEWFVTVYSKAFFKNLLAFEMSPKSPTQWEVASYINLMKSLIEGPEDVKELRERRILFNALGSDQEVLNVYKDINTHGVDNHQVFRQVKDQIEAHYSSSVKRWMAELFHNNFRSPWTAIAFLAAFSVLAIALLSSTMPCIHLRTNSILHMS